MAQTDIFPAFFHVSTDHYWAQAVDWLTETLPKDDDQLKELAPLCIVASASAIEASLFAAFEDGLDRQTMLMTDVPFSKLVTDTMRRRYRNSSLSERWKLVCDLGAFDFLPRSGDLHERVIHLSKLRNRLVHAGSVSDEASESWLSTAKEEAAKMLGKEPTDEVSFGEIISLVQSPPENVQDGWKNLEEVSRKFRILSSGTTSLERLLSPNACTWALNCAREFTGQVDVILRAAR